MLDELEADRVLGAHHGGAGELAAEGGDAVEVAPGGVVAQLRQAGERQHRDVAPQPDLGGLRGDPPLEVAVELRELGLLVGEQLDLPVGALLLGRQLAGARLDQVTELDLAPLEVGRAQAVGEERGEQGCGDRREPEPGGLVEARRDPEGERRGAAAEAPVVAGGGDLEDVASGGQAAVDRDPAAAGVGPIGVVAREPVAEAHRLRRDEGERRVAHLELVGAGGQPQLAAGERQTPAVEPDLRDGGRRGADPRGDRGRIDRDDPAHGGDPEASVAAAPTRRLTAAAALGARHAVAAVEHERRDRAARAGGDRLEIGPRDAVDAAVAGDPERALAVVEQAREVVVGKSGRRSQALRAAAGEAHQAAAIGGRPEGAPAVVEQVPHRHGGQAGRPRRRAARRRRGARRRRP